MEIASLVLEYLKVLVWPLTVIVLGVMFKAPLSALLRRIKKINFAGGTLDADADEASNAVDELSVETATSKDAVTSQDDAPAQAGAGSGVRRDAPALSHDGSNAQVPGDGKSEQVAEAEAPEGRRKASKGWTRVLREAASEGHFYENARQLAVSSPEAAVRETYQKLRLRTLELLRNVRPEERVMRRTLYSMVEKLAQIGVINLEATEPAGMLDRIYDLSRKRDLELSPNGALSFIDAAQKLEGVLSNAIGKYDGRYRGYLTAALPKVQDLISRYDFSQPVSATVSSDELVVRVTGSMDDLEADPKFRGFFTELEALGVKERLPITLKHDRGARYLLSR